ncbi:MAG: CDP-alcohol phosphatidyltransferase family protein [Candidatus Paceibacterota bacterium]
MLTDELRKRTSGLTTSIGKSLGKMGVSADAITFMVLVTGLIAAYYIYMEEFLIAFILVLVSGIFDGLDGAVAKANQKETKFGALFDSVTDKVTEISWYLALGLLSPGLWLPVSLSIAFFMLASYISKHSKAVGGKSGGGIMERKERLVLILIGLLRMDWMLSILWIIAILSIITCFQRFYKNYNILKGLKKEG